MFATSVVGFITAHGKDSKKENTGFVFKYCSVFGTGTTYLGRAWGSYLRVLFYQSDLLNVVVPQGWDAWLFEGNEKTITYAKYDCRGSGSNTAGRVHWATKMDLQTMNHFADMSYIDPEVWLKNNLKWIQLIIQPIEIQFSPVNSKWG